MKLSDFVVPDAIIVDLQATTKEDAIREIVTSLQELLRVLRPGGVIVAAAISRFASTLDGLRTGAFDDPVFAAIATQDLRDGQHRNPTDNPLYFTTAYFHRPEELAAEPREAGGLFGEAWGRRRTHRGWRYFAAGASH